MKGEFYCGKLVGFDTDQATLELWDNENQETISIDIGTNVSLPLSYGWENLFMREINVGVIDGVKTVIELLVE